VHQITAEKETEKNIRLSFLRTEPNYGSIATAKRGRIKITENFSMQNA
jgi:hypothetical protein